MKKLKIGGIFFLMTIAAISMTYCTINKKTAIAAVPVEQDRGHQLYQQFCADCHGVKMQAFVDWQWKHGTSDHEIYESIAQGRAEGAMPAYGDALSKEQIDDLVGYIQYGFKNLNRYAKDEGFDAGAIFTSKDLSFKLEEVVSDMKSPWGMTSLDSERLLVTEKDGQLFIVDKAGIKIEVENTPEVHRRGQGGLMDVVLHPGFDENQLVYLSYSASKKIDNKTRTTTKVSRYRLVGHSLQDEKDIFEAFPYERTRHHYGSRLVFDDDGYLYITIGDRGRRDDHPQSLTVHAGKVHRVNDDGTVPTDNPLTDNKSAIKSTYSYGHRNQQGIAKHPLTGEIWSHEHGPRGGDELNMIKSGSNYGWPTASYGINYNGTVFTSLTESPEFDSPNHYWVPSIAPCGMSFVESDKYPGWNNHLLVGSLKFEYLNLCKIDGPRVISEEILMKGIGRVRDIHQGKDGYIYFSVENPGKIYRIVPVNRT